MLDYSEAASGKKNTLKTQQVAKNDGVCSTAMAVLLHFRAGGTSL